MAKNLTTCTLAALDELGRIIDAKQILEICLEQFENPNSETSTRVDLLITLYLAHMENHLNELGTHLNNIKDYIKGDSDLGLNGR